MNNREWPGVEALHDRRTDAIPCRGPRRRPGHRPLITVPVAVVAKETGTGAETGLGAVTVTATESDTDTESETETASDSGRDAATVGISRLDIDLEF